MRSMRWILLAVGMMGVAAPMAWGQEVQAKAPAFEVVSVRPNQSGSREQSFGPTADGFRVMNFSMLVVIMTAYVPQTGATAMFTPDQMAGLPEWVSRDRYDIEAKVAEADRAEWQKPAAQAAMLRGMLQGMLAERLKLVVHRDMKEVPVYLLEVGKGGPKFKATNPDEQHPGGMKLPWGGTVVPEESGRIMHLYGSTMAALAPMLADSVGRPVQDKTGLTGGYDFRLEKPAPRGAAQDGVSDAGPSVFSVVEGLGLKLEQGKGQVETLVIDHVERPSEN